MIYIIRLSVIGIGGVGKSFLQLLLDKEMELKKEGIQFIVNYIMNSKIGVYKEDGISLKEFLNLYEEDINLLNYYENINYDELLKKNNVDFLVEMTPTNKTTGEPGMTYIMKALKNGINVVTANKGPILLAYKKLKRLAKENDVQIGIGCTTGGALPTINAGIMDLAGANILSIEGVLNGTTNYIIKEMENENITYEQALLKAQKLGIAETDPYLDVEGWDTAIKLLIITNVLMNEEKTLDDVNVKGITHLTLKDIQNAWSRGNRYRLVGKAQTVNNEIKISVSLEEVGQENPFFFVEGKNKAVKYQTDTLGELLIIGGQSGTTAAAASVLRDIINIIRGCKF